MSLMDYLFTKGFAYYLGAIIIVALLCVIILRRRMTFLEKIRRKRLSKIKTSDFLTSHSNDNIDTSEIKQQSLNNLKKRFSITRRALYFTLIFVTIIIALVPLIGNISPTLISAVVACISIIFGIAAKPFIENLICGLVLCFGKLARIGDVVLVDNEYGTIEDVTLTHCIIRRWDWLRYVVPNSLMMTKEFVNYSLRDNYRWVYVEFWVHNSADLEVVEEIAKASPKDSKYYSNSEEPRFWIVDLTPESAKCMVVAWSISAADGWMLSIDIRKQLLLDFKKHGIQTHQQNIALYNMPQTKKTEGNFGNY